MRLLSFVPPRGRGLALVAFLLAGCGKDEVPVYPARGSVTIGGRPAGGVLVILVPADAGADPSAPRPHGTTEDDGTFRLTTRALDDGAPAGQYRVRLVPGIVSPLMAKAKGKGPRPVIPQDFRDEAKTPLRATVTASKEGQTLPPFEVP